MTASLAFIDVLARSSLLLALSGCAVVGVHKAGGSAAMRHMVWLLGMTALLLFPLVAAWLPPLPLPVLPASPPPDVAPSLSVPAEPASVGAANVEPAASLGAGDLLQLVYAAGVVALLARLAIGRHLLARLWRRARPTRDAQWAALLGDLAETLAIRRPVSLRIAGGPTMPMTWGTLRPRVLLPAEALCWTTERRRIVLLHELAHVARRDSFSRTAAAIVCALYWFHPAVWYAARRMRLEQEHACDDLALSLGAEPDMYARNLLRAAVEFRPPSLASLSVGMARTSELECRLTAILRSSARGRSSAGFGTGSAAAALVATLAVATVAPVAAVTPLPPPEVLREGSIVGATNQRAAQPSLALSSRPVAPRRTPTSVARSIHHEVRPQAAIVSPPAAVPAESYEQMVERHRRDLDAYNVRLAEYNRVLAAHSRQFNRDLAAYNRRLRELSVQGNLGSSGNSGNSGNSGHSGNSGNFGNPGRPAQGGQPAIAATPPTPPTMPTMPTPPTPPTMPTPLKRVAAAPSSQGP